MKALNLQNVKNDFFIPICNLYFDEALKGLKSNEFKTYISLLYIVKAIGPNTKLYFSSKAEIFQKISKVHNISEKTFLGHLKKLESRGVISIDGRTVDICFNIEDAKNVGFTSINILDLEMLLLNLDANELKLYMSLLRLLKGFNRKSANITYAQLKTWSAIKNKAIFISTRDSLTEKGLISTLLEINSGSFQFKLKEISNHFSFKTEEKKLHQEEKQLLKPEETVKKKPHINKSIPLEKKYNKKSFEKSKQNSFNQQKEKFKAQNEEKIFIFLSENYKTQNFDENEKRALYENLIEDLKNFGGFNGDQIKSTPDYYLSLEHEKYGRIIDKIIERYYFRLEKEKRENESRQMFLKMLQACYPEKVRGLDDFKDNDFSCHKLDRLIQQCPGAGYFSDRFIFREKEVENPNYDENVSIASNEYMNDLIKNRVGDKELSLNERLALIKEFLPIVEEKYPTVSEYLIEREKLNFDEFCSLYREDHYGLELV